MKNYTFSRLILFFLFQNLNTSAQDSYFPVLSMKIQTIAIANSTLGGLPDISDSTVFKTTMIVSLTDTTLIDKIYVLLGDSGNTSNRLQKIFDWDVFGSTGNGTSYTRNSYDVILGLGNYMDLLNYNASVRVKRTDGSFTDLVEFSR